MCVGWFVGLILYNSRNCWSILMRFFIELLKSTRVSWAIFFFESKQLAIFSGKTLFLRCADLIETILFGKAVFDNVYTFPRFARTSERHWGDWKWIISATCNVGYLPFFTTNVIYSYQNLFKIHFCGTFFRKQRLKPPKPQK